MMAKLLDTDTPEIIEQRISQALRLANDKVNEEAVRLGFKIGDMGTTGAVVKIWKGPNGEKKLIFGNTGDSRIWRFNHNTNLLVAISTDYNILRNDLESGRITQAQYDRISDALDTLKNATSVDPEIQAYFRTRNIITQYIGVPYSKFDYEASIVDVSPGDLILITSDGVHDNLTYDEVRDALIQSQDPAEIAKNLTEKSKAYSETQDRFDPEGALKRPKPDDITAVIIKVPTTPVGTAPTSTTPAPEMPDARR